MLQPFSKYNLGFDLSESENVVSFLQIEPTTRCNFKCKFCCGRYMDQSDFNVNLLEKALELFPHLKHIELQGEGEPLLHPRFFEMLKLIKQKGIKISFITNGSFLTAQYIEQILDSHVHSICVSIESPDPEEFRKIRGGDLSKILQGIEDLILARDKRGQKYPAVGWAVTVLDSTKHQLPLIADIYTRLGMDGGIRFQFLSEMKSYTEIYDHATSNQRVKLEDESWIFSQYIEVIKSIQFNRSPFKHFYDELEEVKSLGNQTITLDSTQLFNRVFQSCPWLDQALFINRHGITTGCPMIKDTDRFAFGKLGEEDTEIILKSRQEMREKVQEGIIPESCQKCFIAESISQRLLRLQDLKPKKSLSHLGKSSIHKPLVVGDIPIDKTLEKIILGYVDGKSTCNEIFNRIYFDHQGLAVTSTKILSIIDAMIRREILFI